MQKRVPQIKSDRPGGQYCCFRISDGIEVYFAQIFKITELPLFMISSQNLNYLGGLGPMINSSYRNSIAKTPDHKILCIFPPNFKTLKDMHGYGIITIRAYVLLETVNMPLFGFGN